MTTLTTWAMTIPALPSALLKPGAHQHWRVAHRAKQQDTETAFWLAKQAGAPPQPLAAVRATVTFVVAQRRRRDRDNWAARCKGFWDGLVRAGILADDDGETIRSVELRWVVDKANAPKTLIELEAV